ncbi:MAG: hypothetical protein AMXMBFR83_04900 [Phycisphaerae bacterium]
MNRWLGCLGWSLAVASGLFVIAVAVQRSFAVVEDSQRPYGWLALALLGGAALASVVWSLITREDLRASAAHLDRAAGLKERISSGLYCQSLADEFARAVVADAERVSRGLSIRHHLPVRVPDSAAWAGGSVVLAALFFLLFPTLDLAGKQADRIERKDRRDRIERTQAAIRPLIQPDVSKLKEQHPELGKELEELEALKDARLETPADLRHEMMKKIEKIGEKLEQQSQQNNLEKINDFKQMMRRLSNEPKTDTPVSDLSKALAKGDLNAAQEAIQQIRQRLAQEAKTPEEKQKAEQTKEELKNLSDKLNQMAADQKKLNEQMSKAGLSREEARKALENLQKGDLQAVRKQLEEKGLSSRQAEQLANQMKKQCDAGSMASKLGQNLAKAAAGMKSDAGSALSDSEMQGLSDAAQQLSDLEQTEQQLNDLKSSLSSLNSMKNKVGQGCAQCNGSGKDAGGKPCSACGGSGLGQQGQAGDPNNMGGGMGNLGRGDGGLRPMEETQFGTVNRKAQVHTDRGAIISTQFINGEQIKGEVSKEFYDATLAPRMEAAENVEQEKTPRPYRKSITEYFDRTRVDRPATAPAK